MDTAIQFDPLAGMRPRWMVKPLVTLANKMAGPLFIVQFVLFLIVWMAWNTIGPLHFEFDRWPFMGLNLFMSALAGIQAAVIGVKQTISDYKRDYEAQCHNAKYDKLLEHNTELAEKLVQLEEARAKDAQRREEIQEKILAALEGRAGA